VIIGHDKVKGMTMGVGSKDGTEEKKSEDEVKEWRTRDK
jgi:hypothetical protein